MVRLRAALYARVSKAERDDPTSVPVQLTECRRRAKEEGWEVVGEFADTGISAWNPRQKRPQFERLLGEVEAERVECIVVREQERLLRQMRDAIRIQDLAEAGRLKLIAATMESDVNFRRARDRDDFRKRASQAQFYSDFLSEKVRATKEARKDEGAYTGGEQEPFGYRRINGDLAVDADEASLLRDAVRRLGQGHTATRICREWNAEGRQTSRGARWRPQTLRRTLLSDHLTGGRGYPRVLSNEEAAIARAALASEDRQPGRQTGLKAPLAGYVFCAECKMKMTTGSGYYRCSTSHGGCGQTSIKGQPLEHYVFSEIPHRWKPRLQWQQRPSGESKKLMDELRDLEAREKEITDELSDPKSRLTPKIAGAATRKIEARRKEVTQILSRDLPSPEPPPITDPKQIAEAMFTGAIAFLRDVLGKTVERVVVSRRQQRGREFDPERVEIVWR
jgi:DNA invertase Pin-like site-specific DNA recombinase